MNIQYLGNQAKVNIPVINGETRPLTFSVNGVRVTIPRGEDVVVDAKYAEIIERYWDARHYDVPTEEDLKAQEEEKIGAIVEEKVSQKLENMGGIYPLWEGNFVDGVISFTVPKKYYHQNGRILTLLIESGNENRVENLSGDGSEIIVIAIPESFEQYEVFYGRFESVEIASSGSERGDIRLSVSMLADERYSTCFVNAYEADGTIISGIYAIVPQEVQDV